MQDPDDSDAKQGVLDFENGSLNGFTNWRNQQEQWSAQFRAASGLPIGQIVRLKLQNIDCELVGRLAVVGQPNVVPKATSLRLVVAGVEFAAAEIEHCLVQD